MACAAVKEGIPCSNSTALQDFSRNVGLLLFVKSNCAQSEIGENWMEHRTDHCIGMLTSEPGHPWQNPAEKRIGTLGNMVVANMRETGMPVQCHNWMQLWCVDVHNVLSGKNLGHQNPQCCSTGCTTDISKFRFCPWEPIWCCVLSAKAPHDNLKKARWLGFAHTAGDEMTCHIRTEKEPGEGRNMILIRSLIKTRRKKIGTQDEHVDDEPDVNEFLLEMNVRKGSDLLEEVETVEDKELWLEQNPAIDDDAVEMFPEGHADDVLPPEHEDHLTAEEAEEPHDQFQLEDDDNCEFERIVDHKLTASGLMLTVKHAGDTEEETSQVPFSVLKKDVPLELARCIRDKVVEDSRQGHCNTWVRKVIKNHGRTIRRIQRHHNIGCAIRAQKNRTKSGMSRNQRNAATPLREKHGIRIPQSIRQAIIFDDETRMRNGKTPWLKRVGV